MIEDVSTEGETKSLGTQISEMIHRLSVRGAYDIVLIDSRAGLAELAAPAVLGLGALVLLFGTAQEQTIDGYRALFAGLNLLAIRALEQGDSADWRLLLKPVYAKASLEPQIGARHEADLYDLFADNLYDQEDDQSEFGVNFGADDQEAPHAPLVIPFDSRFVDFDPARYQGHMAKAFYEQTFRTFLNGLDRVVSDLIEESKL